MNIGRQVFPQGDICLRGEDRGQKKFLGWLDSEATP